MKKSELLFSAVRVPIDVAMIILAAITAYNMHLSLAVSDLDLKPLVFSFSAYMEVVFLATPFFILLYAIEGLYDIKVTRKFWREILKTILATAVGLVIVIVAIFLQRAWFSSRFIVVAGGTLIVLYVSFARLFLHIVQRWLLVKKGYGVHRVLLIGDTHKIKPFKKFLRDHPGLGYKIIGKIAKVNITEIKKIKKQKGIDVIILGDHLTEKQQTALIDYCAINNIEFKYIPTLLQTTKIETQILGGSPLISVKHTPLDGWWRIIKRAFDIVSSIILIILTGPIMLAVIIAIKLEDRGPAVFKNERIGINGEKFFVYKFRYMKQEFCVSKDNPAYQKALEFEKELIAKQNVRSGPLYKIKKDPRKTRVGDFIERTSIDELPQFFNVLRGNMSLVGPRPHQEREVNKYREEHRRLLTLKPGVTGMAQVSGRSDLDFEDEYKLDLFYIENWNLWLDIQICLKTVKVLLRKRKNM